MTLASFFSWADQFVSYLVENPEDRFSCDKAQFITNCSKVMLLLDCRSAFCLYLTFLFVLFKIARLPSFRKVLSSWLSTGAVLRYAVLLFVLLFVFISHLVSGAGCGIWSYQFLIIAWLYQSVPDHCLDCISSWSWPWLYQFLIIALIVSVPDHCLDCISSWSLPDCISSWSLPWVYQFLIIALIVSVPDHCLDCISSWSLLWLYQFLIIALSVSVPDHCLLSTSTSYMVHSKLTVASTSENTVCTLDFMENSSP